MFNGLRDKFTQFVKRHIVDDIPPELNDEANYGWLIADIAEAEDVHPEKILRLKLQWELMGIECDNPNDFHNRVKIHLPHQNLS